MGKTLGLRWIVAVLGGTVLLLAALACTTEVEVPGETVVVEEVPGETVVVEKEVVKQVEVPGETVIVEKEVVKQVEVPGETVVVEKIVVATPLPEPQQSGELVVGVTVVNPPIFLPSEEHFAAGAFLADVGVFESLFRHSWADPPGLGEPSSEGIGTSWTIGPDQSYVDIKIRDGVMFNGGYGELTVEDVVHSYSDAIREGSQFQRADFHKRYLKSAEVIDGNTMRLNTRTPDEGGIGGLDPTWWRQAANITGDFVFMVSKKVYDEKGPEEALTTMVATGPFDAVSWVAGEELITEPKVSHWRGVSPRIERGRFIELPEISTQIAAWQVGEIHMFKPPIRFIRDTIDSVPRSWRKELDRGTGQSVVFGGNYWAEKWLERDEVVFPRPGLKADDAHPWIGDPRDDATMERARKVRRALSMAIDRELLNTVALDGLGRVSYTNSGFKDTDKGWNPDWVIPYDPDGAKALLAETGFPDCFTIPFQIAPDLGVVVIVDVGKAVAQMWTQIGCKVEIEQTAYSARRPTLVERSIDIPWLMQSEAYSFLDQSKFHSMIPNAGFNYGVELPNDISQPWYDNLKIDDPAERIANNAKIEEFVSHWMLFAPMVERTQSWLIRPEVVEWRPYFGLGVNSIETVVLER
jgi:ABC-type transport system substrate-binding protein